MPTPPEAIARRLAARFAPELGESLTILTDQTLAGGRGDETPFRSADPQLVLAFASFVVSLSGLAWGIYQSLRQNGQTRQHEEALTSEVQALQKETVFLKGVLLIALQKEAPRLTGLDDPMRERLLNAAADEALAEAAKRARS